MLIVWDLSLRLQLLPQFCLATELPAQVTLVINP